MFVPVGGGLFNKEIDSSLCSHNYELLLLRIRGAAADGRGDDRAVGLLPSISIINGSDRLTTCP